MARPKGENTLRKHFKLTEETAKLLAECSKAENMNESEYIRYLLMNQSGHLKSKDMELMRNEVNKIGLNVNQIVKNNNSHLYRESDKINLIKHMEEIKGMIEELVTIIMAK